METLVEFISQHTVVVFAAVGSFLVGVLQNVISDLLSEKILKSHEEARKKRERFIEEASNVIRLDEYKKNRSKY